METEEEEEATSSILVGDRGGEGYFSLGWRRAPPWLGGRARGKSGNCDPDSKSSVTCTIQVYIRRLGALQSNCNETDITHETEYRKSMRQMV